MRKNRQLKDWTGVIARHFSHLSKPQIKGLAQWSFGMAMSQSSGLSTVSAFLGRLLGQSENSVRQRLRDWYKDAKEKAGEQRQQLEVSSCFGPLLAWVLSLWVSDSRQLPLAMDATTLGQRFSVLSIGVLYRGCSIPIAWKVVKATEAGSWRPYWLELFDCLKAIVPPGWQVTVSADRGLYADWLYRKIVELEWHPLLRINLGGTFCPAGEREFRPLRDFVPKTGTEQSLCGRCFKSNPLECTLLARWDEGYQDPWLIVTDLPPAQAEAAWYGLRAWQECGYRDIKSDGWQWQHTRMDDPTRAERLWLAMAVATLWAVNWGGTKMLCNPHRRPPLNLPLPQRLTLAPHLASSLAFAEG